MRRNEIQARVLQILERVGGGKPGGNWDIHGSLRGQTFPSSFAISPAGCPRRARFFTAPCTTRGPTACPRDRPLTRFQTLDEIVILVE
jgi:hypothetical protein